MKTKTKKKTISFFVASVLAMTSLCTLFTATGCNEPEMTGIEVTSAPTKVSYVLGEKFDTAGMVVSKVFDNDTKEALATTDYSYSPDGALKLADKKVTITYGDYTCTQPITVTNDIVSVEIITNPVKMEYVSGELFDPTGMTIQATLQNNEKEEIVTVTSEIVTYKNTALKPTDTNNFEMVYGGYSFNLPIEVSSGAFIEAEAGLPITDGIKIAAAPTVQAIEEDLINKPSTNGDGYYCLRGIDNGKTVYSELHKDGPGNYLVDGIRCDLDTYVATDPEMCAATGGYYVGSGAPRDNIVEFSGNKNAQLMYSLTGSATGSTKMTFRMSNPNIDGQTAPETKLNTVLKVTVNGQDVTISDDVKLAAVDFTKYKAYNPDTKAYDGKNVSPKYYWQEVTIDVDLNEGGNSIVVESISDRTVRIDSITYKSTNVDLTNECTFAPEVVSAQLKAENDEVYLGVIVEANETGYGEDGAMTVLALSTITGTRCATYSGNVNVQGENDPWTQATKNGGLGYTTAPTLFGDNGRNYQKGLKASSVEKITDGKHAGLYCVWYKLNAFDDNHLGVLLISEFSYGADYKTNRPLNDILKTDENVTAESGGYCYQVYCDTRDNNITFGWGELALVVQKGTFDESKATDECPLRNKLMRKYIDHWTADKNDAELVELHNK